MKSKLLLLLLSLFYFHCQPPRSLSSINSTDQPNIIILFADDMGYGDMTNAGHPTIHTPNLDLLAANGMKLTNFYSGSPACTASRYALLTGKYPIRSGFGWVLYPKSKRGIHSKEITIAEGLKSVGYSTACFGKWHLGSTKKEYLPLQNGFDEYLGLPYSNDMRPPKWASIPLFSGNDTLELDPDQSQLTKRYTEHAVHFIEKNKKKPFFLYVPYAMPHVPLYASEDFKGKSQRGLYGDVIEEIDWSVGEIIKTLQQLNISKNTLVFFTSDNGPWIIKGLKGGSSGLFRDGKGSTWEGGMRVPAIAYWENTIPAGSVNMSVTSALDLKETCFELGGVRDVRGVVTSSLETDGKSLVPIFKKNTDFEEDRTFFYYGLNNKLLAMRKGKWKIHIKTYSQTKQTYFEDEMPLLFNLKTDPSEQFNIAKEHTDLVQSLLEEIDNHQKTVKDKGSFYDK